MVFTYKDSGNKGKWGLLFTLDWWQVAERFLASVIKSRYYSDRALIITSDEDSF